MVAKSDYSFNYLKNSFFQILATGIGFLSLFIVVPFLSENKVLYGIYSVCISLTIFFNYADFGFITVCQKYVGEYYAKNDLREEIKIVGFTSIDFICCHSRFFFATNCDFTTYTNRGHKTE